MSTPTDSARDELRVLRERAYGRDADILDDPAALARLSELEEQAAVSRPAGPAASGPITGDDGPSSPADQDALAGTAEPPAFGTTPYAVAAPHPFDGEAPTPTNGHRAPSLDAPDPPDPSDREAGGASLPADDDDATAEEAPARRWWRRIPFLWAASVAAAVLVGVGLTLLVQSMESGKVGVLQVDPEADWPQEVWGGPTEDAVAFEPFYGVSVLSQPQVMGDGSQGPLPCIIVFTGVGENPSYLAGACGAGTFPAQAALVVDRQTPDELRERFPEGTALQFVLDGSQVHVYAREPGIVLPTP